MILATYRFKQHAILLVELIDNVQQTQTVLGEILKTLRMFGVPFTKNPLLKVNSELLELEYHLRQHIVNCAVYQDLIDSGIVIDSDFIQELKGMILIGGSLFKRSEMAHKELKKRYGNITERLQSSVQIELKNILEKTPITLTDLSEKKKPIAAG